MQLRTFAKFIVIPSCLVVVLLAGAMLAIPLLLDRATVRDEATKRLSQWAGTTIDVDGAINISYFPDVRLNASEVKVGRLRPLRQVSGVSAKRLQARLNWLPLFFGKIEIGELTLVEPVIKLDSTDEADAKDDADIPNIKTVTKLSPLIRFLQRASVGKVIVHGGRVARTVEGSPSDILDQINGQLRIPEGQFAASGSGTFGWHGKVVRFNIVSSPVESEKDVPATQMALKLAADNMTAAFDGEVSIFDAIQMSGKLDLSVPDMRAAGNWLGYTVPGGPGLRNFRAHGNFSWVGDKLEFDRAAFYIDGNSATGALSVSHLQSPPVVEGTIALQELKLTEYFSQPNIKGGESPMGAPLVRALNLGLLKHFNADIRLSAGAIELGNVRTGRAAATVTLNNAKLVADFAEVSVFEGNGLMSVELDMSTPTVGVGFSGELKQVKADQLLPLLRVGPVVGGSADVSASIKAQGPSLQDILASLDGSAKIDMGQGGEVAVDLADLIDQASKGQTQGWGAALGGKTNFDQLIADFQIQQGKMQTQTFKLLTKEKTVTGDGTLDVGQKSVDVDLTISQNGPEGGNARQSEPERDLKLSVRGPWANPTIVDKRSRALFYAPQPGAASSRFADAVQP